MAHVEISQETMESLRAILNYNWADEAADYEQCDEEGNSREGHVFEHMTRVSEWLDDVATGGTGREGGVRLAWEIDPYNSPAHQRLDAIIAINHDLSKRLDAHRHMLSVEIRGRAEELMSRTAESQKICEPVGKWWAAFDDGSIWPVEVLSTNIFGRLVRATAPKRAAGRVRFPPEPRLRQQVQPPQERLLGL